MTAATLDQRCLKRTTRDIRPIVGSPAGGQKLSGRQFIKKA
jgi:hypothetical protein